MAEAFMKELLFKNIDTPEFAERLDLELDEGGAGWNKLRAQSFADRTGMIIEQARQLKEAPEKGPATLSAYLASFFHLNLSDEQTLRFQAALKARIDSQIGQIELQKRLDTPLSQGGVGLHKRTSEKLVREVEIIMLLKYS